MERVTGPAVLSIGTTHPQNVAGVGRDVIVGTGLGVRVFTAIAAVSAQDDSGVHALHVLPPENLAAQLASIARSELRAVRIGALGSAENTDVVAVYLASVGVVAVVDPVRYASSGGALLDDRAWAVLRDRLAAMHNVVLTPNVPEAEALLGESIRTSEESARAALALQARGPRAVLVKGGHLSGDPVDALATEGDVEMFARAHLPVRARGTGCTLAMAIACGLAKGESLRDAVVDARAYVHAKMEALLREETVR